MAIVIVGMLDEREDALKVIKDRIEGREHKAILIDISIGTGAGVSSLKPEVTSREIIESMGGTVEGVRAMLATERDKATGLVAEGLVRKVADLHNAGELQGIIAIAGMTGTFISLASMKALPFGVPKVLISSVAAMPAYAGKLADYFGLRDITVMHTVVDTVGMNGLIRTLAVNGANAISGMVESGPAATEEKRPTIALTEFGFCEKGAHYIRDFLQKEYEIVSFHATGLGDRAAVELVSQGLFAAFIDLVPASFGEYLLGGNRASGPHRLDALSDVPIPYVFSPCGFDMISCGPIERRDKNDPLWVSRKLADRKLLLQDAMRVQARTSAEEMEAVAVAVAEKLNGYKYKKMVKVVIPKKGFSSLGVEGAALHDPASDEAFVAALKRDLNPEIKVLEVDSHINAIEYAQVVTLALAEALNAHRKEGPA